MNIEKSTAKRLYNESPDWFKSELVKQFGKECFVPKDYENIKTPIDACVKLGINIQDIINEHDTPDEKAYKLLKVVIKSVQPDFVPDWNNTDQKKWWPWFNLSSGFGFSDSGYCYDITYSDVGSRLCFESKEKCEYVATQFIDLYKQFLTI